MTDFNDDARDVYRRVEVLTRPGRRRRWSDEQKMVVAAEAMVLGAVVLQIARRWQICPSQVFTWRRLALRTKPSSLSTILQALSLAAWSQRDKVLAECLELTVTDASHPPRGAVVFAKH